MDIDLCTLPGQTDLEELPRDAFTRVNDGNLDRDLIGVWSDVNFAEDELDVAILRMKVESARLLDAAEDGRGRPS